MKKVVGSRTYNTDTAKFIGTWDNGREKDSINYRSETLYRKKNGEFFMCYSIGFEQELKPVSYSDAECWALYRLDEEVHGKYFSSDLADGNGGKTSVCYSLKNSTIELLKRAAAEQGISIGSVIDSLAEDRYGR